jgi:hypothetical protein
MNPLERELFDEKLAGIKKHQEDSFALVNEKLENILQQTTKTNGRVTVLEQYKWKIVGVSIALSSIFGLAITLITIYLKL